MRSKNNMNDMQMDHKSWLLLAVSTAILPLCLLVPFMDHSSQLEPAFAGSKISCTTNASLVIHNQCASWAQPKTMWPIALLFLLILGAVSLAMNVYASRLAHRDGRRFANYRLQAAIAVSVVSFIAYVIMRGSSQNYDSGNFGLAPFAVSYGASDSYKLVSLARFGYGLTPVMVLLLTAGFIAPMLLSWHRFMYSRNYIDGQKKQRLFQ